MKQITDRIEQIVLEYQNAIADYYEMEVPMEDDAANMENFLENMKNEILELFE